MLDDILNQIKQEEENSIQITQEAKAKARDILKAVEVAVSEALRNNSQENRQYLQETLEKSKKDFEKMLEVINADKWQTEQLKINQYRSNVDRVAKDIVKRVLNNGNC